MSRDTYFREVFQTACYAVTYKLSFKKIQILETFDKIPPRLLKSFHAIKITQTLKVHINIPYPENHVIKNITQGDGSGRVTLKGLFSESVPPV